MSITKVIGTAFLVTLGSCMAVNSGRQSNVSRPKQPDNLLVDNEGNWYPLKVFADNTLWMTANLRLTISDSYCYDNVEGHCDTYGRLYTWESAQKGCALLGVGWSLPTRNEWQQLASLYGGSFSSDSTGSGKSAYQSLLKSGDSDFNVLLGGGRAADGSYRRLNAHGFYWIATERDGSLAWFWNFGAGSETLYQQDDGEKTDAFSVRCTKRIDTLK